MEKLFLQEGMSQWGVSFEKFVDAINHMAEVTTMFTYPSDNEITNPADGLYHIESYDVDRKILCCRKASNKRKADIHWTDKPDVIAEEIANSTKMLLRCFGKNYLVSESALLSFGERYHTSACMYPYFEKDAFISRLMVEHPQNWNVVCRSEDKVNKIYAIASERYEYISQDIMVDLAGALLSTPVMGEGVFESFEIDHDITSFIISFPEKGKEIREAYGFFDKDFVPAIRVTTSDTCVCSFTVQACWMRGSHFSIQEEVAIRHIGKYANREHILKEVEDKIFPTYTKLPEALCEAMGIFISPDTPFTEEENRTEMEEYFELISHRLGIKKDLGNDVFKGIRDIVLNDFDYSMPITAYDFVTDMLSLPGRVTGVPKSRQRRFERMCGKAAFVNLAPPEKVVLMATA